jgi:excisionase family DNA binding protein
MPTGSEPTIEFLTPNELASLLKISKVGVYRLIERRQIPFHRIRGSLRFDKNDVLSYLQQNRVEPIGPQQHGSKKNNRFGGPNGNRTRVPDVRDRNKPFTT